MSTTLATVVEEMSLRLAGCSEAEIRRLQFLRWRIATGRLTC